MSNLPDGVTGFEYELAGPDFEEDITAFCYGCETDVATVQYWFRGHGWWECPNCLYREDWHD